MKKSIIFSVVAMAVGVQAGVYTQDFETAANGSTDLGDGSTIPEPATMGLVALFSGGLFVVRRVFQI